MHTHNQPCCRKERRPHVAAVVVTYNRKNLLLECLSGLLAQSTPVDRVYVIDNASTDGTFETLQQSGYLAYPAIQYVRLDSNCGGAGGFAAGMKRAYDDGFDWFWLMDDDVEPYRDGLAQLLEFQHESGCIHGRKQNVDGTPFVWIEQFSPRTVTTKRIADPLFAQGTQSYEINTGCFEGMLVSRDVVARIGFPDPEFFITWDDTFYGYLASRVTRVLYVNAYALQRKIAVKAVDSRMFGNHLLQSPLALFHSHRNRWIIAKKLGTCRLPFWISSARFFVRAVFRELFLVWSVSRAASIVKGAWSGIQCQVQTRLPLPLEPVQPSR